MAIFPIEPSGPGVPTDRSSAALIFVSRNTSASIHKAASFCRSDCRFRSTAFQIPSACPIKPPPRGGSRPPIATRSFISVVRTTRHPSPIAPRREASGPRTSERKTSLNSASPVSWNKGRGSTPAACMSSTKYVRPRCRGNSGSVRAIRRPQRARCPSVVQTFCPGTIHSSPSRTARVARLARSEPATGSLNN